MISVICRSAKCVEAAAIATTAVSAPLPEPLATDVIMNKGLLRLVDYKKAWAKVGLATLLAVLGGVATSWGEAIYSWFQVPKGH